MKESIISALQGLATTTELKALESWRRESSENEAQYREIVSLWKATERSPETASTPASVAAVIRAADEREEAKVIPMMNRTPRRPRRTPLAVAAAIVAVAFSAIALWLVSGPRMPALAGTEIVTGAGETVTTRLSDGTTVRLAPYSRLLIRASTDAREVWLDGHGFFAVAHHDARPFTIRTRAGDAVVLGTRFDIRVREQEVRVAVVEGRVALDAGGDRVEAAAGQIGLARGGDPPTVSNVADLEPLLAWMDGFLVFQDTPLAIVAREIEARYGIHVILPDPTVGERTVSAWFMTEDAGEVLSVVCRAAGAHCTLQDSVASIEP